MKIRVWFSTEAERQAARISEWWTTNRSAVPMLFGYELETAVRLLAEAPAVGAKYTRTRVPGVRRLLLRKTKFHLYYVYDEPTGFVTVVAIWGAIRRRGPRLSMKSLAAQP